ncbi:hypothetical protein KIPB_010516, partial [Kipferlia bialata]|eukprot:g10516.t1
MSGDGWADSPVMLDSTCEMEGVRDRPVRAPRPDGTHTRRMTILLSSSLVGSSFLSFPYAFMETGIVLGIVVLCVMFYLHRSACNSLIRATQLTRGSSLEQVLRMVAGKGISRPFTAMLGVMNCCYMFPYVIAAGDYMRSFFPGVTLLESRIIATSFTMLPLSLMPNVNGLSFASVLSFASAILIVVVSLVVVYEVGEGADVPAIPSQYTSLTWLLEPPNGFLQGLATGMPLMVLLFGTEWAISSMYSNLVGSPKERGRVLR